MSTLREMQAAIRQSVVRRDSAAASATLAAHVPAERLDIYRNTFLLTLTRALQLSFPAVRKLVGAEFFEGAAQIFIAEHLPRAAWLDQYGSAFPEFLRAFPPAASLVYLADVAKLEWAVNAALHAADAEPLDPARLSAVAAEDQGRIRLIATPSLNLIEASYPADEIWRAVLASDDNALRAIDLERGPVRLLVERRATGVAVERLDAARWRLLARLCAGETIETALEATELDCSVALAEHLACGRFCAFELAPQAGAGQGVTGR